MNCHVNKIYSIRGVAHNWISEIILSYRSQFVCYDEFHSDLLNISCGVLHDYILGPRLFMMCIKDLFNTSRFVKYTLFADDINLFYTDKTSINLLQQC